MALRQFYDDAKPLLLTNIHKTKNGEAMAV
jgi:hypothetical protein